MSEQRQDQTQDMGAEGDEGVGTGRVSRWPSWRVKMLPRWYIWWYLRHKCGIKGKKDSDGGSWSSTAEKSRHKI